MKNIVILLNDQDRKKIAQGEEIFRIYQSPVHEVPLLIILSNKSLKRGDFDESYFSTVYSGECECVPIKITPQDIDKMDAESKGIKLLFDSFQILVMPQDVYEFVQPKISQRGYIG